MAQEKSCESEFTDRLEAPGFVLSSSGMGSFSLLALSMFSILQTLDQGLPLEHGKITLEDTVTLS